MQFLLKIANALECAIEFSGRVIAWLVLLLVLIICYDVGMRFFFQAGSVALQELQWHLFSLIFLLGAAYTLKHDGHVRVDAFFQSRFMSDTKRAWVNIFGTIFFLLPFCYLVVITAMPYVEKSYLNGEGSPDPGGLPHRYLLKAAIIVAFVLLIVQGLVMLIRQFEVIQQARANKTNGGQ